MERTERFGKSGKRYNLEPKDNGIVGIHKGMKFERHSKVGIEPKKTKELNVWHQEKQLLVQRWTLVIYPKRVYMEFQRKWYSISKK